jgi:hypothetical protein
VRVFGPTTQPAAILRRPEAWLAFLLFLAHAAIFGSLFHWDLVSDLQIHAAFVRVGIEKNVWWGTPLPYVAAAVLAGWHVGQINHAMTVMLGAAVAAKYLISVRIARRELALQPERSAIRSTNGLPFALLLALALLSFAFSLPANTMYLGQLPPNVFHNSTVVFLMPLALLLFWFSAQFLRRPDNRTILWVAVLGAINVAAKPSFVFPLLVVFPLAALTRFRLRPALWKAVGACVLITAALVTQYIYIYESGATERIYRYSAYGGEATSHVTIDVLRVWSHFSENIPLSLLASFAFPLVALAVYRRRLWDYDLVRYAAALTAVSIVIFALLKETGVREFQANFAWQAMISNYMLFLTVLVRLWSLGTFQRWSARSATVAGTFAAHVAAGIAFLTYYFVNGSYF